MSAGKRVRKNAGLMFGAKGIGALFALAGLAFAARGLSTEEFGLLVFLHAYVLFFTEVATFESWLVVVKHAAGGSMGDGAGKDDTKNFGRVLRFCVTLDILAALVAFALAIGAAFMLSPFIGVMETAAPFILFYGLLILLNQKSASLGVLRLYDRYDLIAANSLVIPFGRMVGCGIAWATGAPFEAYLLAWFLASAISYINLPLLGIRELKRRDMWRAVRDGKLTLKAPVRRLWRFVALTNVDSAIAAGGAQLPVLLAGAVGGASFAAIFRVAQEVAIVLSKGAKMMDRVIFPEFTDLIAKGSGGGVPALAAKTGAALLAIGAVVGGAFWFVGPWFLGTALGETYAGATLLAVLLILGASLEAAAGPIFPALYAAGHPGRAILARSTGIAVMVALFLILYSFFGQSGPGGALILGSATTLTLVAIIASRIDWSQLKIQADFKKSRISAASEETVDPRAGGPGQPGSSQS